MKTKQLLVSALFATTFLLSSSALFAQVKIGTASTTIDPANNLEVQGSTAGRKVAIDKTTGKVTIADGTQGNGKVLTSDALGGASWKAPVTDIFVDAINPANQIVDPTGYVKLTLNTVLSNAGGEFDLTTSEITVPSAGYYLINGGTTKMNTTGTLSISLMVDINNGAYRELIDAIGEQEIIGGPVHLRGTTVLRLSANDKITISVRNLSAMPTAFYGSRIKLIKMFN